MRTGNILFNFHANLIGRFQTARFARGYTIVRIHGCTITRYIVTPAPIKALACLCFFLPMAERSTPSVARVVGDSRQFVFSERIVHVNILTCQTAQCSLDLVRGRRYQKIIQGRIQR